MGKSAGLVAFPVATKLSMEPRRKFDLGVGARQQVEYTAISGATAMESLVGGLHHRVLPSGGPAWAARYGVASKMSGACSLRRIITASQRISKARLDVCAGID